MLVERVTSTTVARTQKAFVYSYTSTDISRKQKRFNMTSSIFKTVSLIAVTACLLSSYLQLLDARSTGSERETPFKDQGGTLQFAKINHSYNIPLEITPTSPCFSCACVQNERFLYRLIAVVPCAIKVPCAKMRCARCCISQLKYATYTHSYPLPTYNGMW